MKPSKKNSAPVVAFTYTDPLAKAVFIAGDFNDWKPASTPLKQTSPGTWQIELDLPPGRYEYLFVVDGKWVTDPLARVCCPNPYGGMNAFVQV